MTYSQRFEKKYLLNLKQYLYLKTYFLNFFKLDNFCKNGNYIVSSLYYDTKELKFYYEKEDGEKNRTKIRLRTYQNSKGLNLQGENMVNLEIKKRINQNVFKKRSLLNESVCKKFIQSPNFEFIQNYKTNALVEAAYISTINSLIPKIVVIYDREAYFSKICANVRLTFDHNLRYRIYNLTPNNISNTLSIIPEDYIIMELKYNTILPLFITKIIRNFDISQCTFSKYYISLEKSMRFSNLNYLNK
jgi:hypothetical protein